MTPRNFRTFFGGAHTGPGTARNHQELLRLPPTAKTLNAGFRVRLLRALHEAAKVSLMDKKSGERLTDANLEVSRQVQNHTEEVRLEQY